MDTHAKTVCHPEVVGVEVAVTVVVDRMMRVLECPRKGVVKKEPLG